MQELLEQMPQLIRSRNVFYFLVCQFDQRREAYLYKCDDRHSQLLRSAFRLPFSLAFSLAFGFTLSPNPDHFRIFLHQIVIHIESLLRDQTAYVVRRERAALSSEAVMSCCNKCRNSSAVETCFT